MTAPSDLQELTLLGQGATQPQRKLETFPNRHPNRRYVVKLETDEFTAVCPMTGQPDFATIRIEYIPNERVVESKSLKLYFWSFRNEGIFHEHVTNVILDDLIEALDPHWCKVTGEFTVRGGIAITVTAEHTRPESA
ncbi:MAG: NADPH-dependent 7-cyano-7-deazaguanine reductase QueF [Anaerolineae bacterium]|nr:NADPH-dependent 7-cyano-7-deazaguanine reductase QueF [Anaerolineae bacterium]